MASLVYRVNCRTARAAQRNYLGKTNKTKKRKKRRVDMRREVRFPMLIHNPCYVAQCCLLYEEVPVLFCSWSALRMPTSWVVAQPLIPALGKQRQAEFCEFEASLVYKS